MNMVLIPGRFSHVPAAKVREVSHMLKAIHAQESRDAADRKARAIVDDLRAAKMNTAADLVERSVSETLTYYAFPDIHWQKIRTNNPLERIMKEIRRRTRVAGAFPDGAVLPQPRPRGCANRRQGARQVCMRHAASPSAASHANRSRRLTKCAKDFAHYLRQANAALSSVATADRNVIQTAGLSCRPCSLGIGALVAAITSSRRTTSGSSYGQPWTQADLEFKRSSQWSITNLKRKRDHNSASELSAVTSR